MYHVFERQEYVITYPGLSTNRDTRSAACGEPYRRVLQKTAEVILDTTFARVIDLQASVFLRRSDHRISI